MAIYAIGDLHLSGGVKKPMDIFPGWENYTQKLEKNWINTVGAGDTVILAGDISWGMNLQEAMPDFILLEKLPGTKLILKGNHDYWWSSAAKMYEAFRSNGLESLHILHNNSYEVEGINICGSRGWLFESGAPHDDKIINREALRMEASIQSVRQKELETVLFLHYPPIYSGQTLLPFIEVMQKYGIKRCYYGHIHGTGHRHAVQGKSCGIEFTMISADYLSFCPLAVKMADSEANDSGLKKD